MTIEQFGQQIKSKYPQYQDIDDAELGQKMLTKYPQYQDLISSDEPAKVKTADTFLQGHGVLKGISDFVGTTGLAKGLAQGIFLKFTPEGKDLMKKIEAGELPYSALEEITGEAATGKEIAGSALQTAATIGTAGIGKATAVTKLGRVGQQAGKLGAASALSSGAQTFGEGGTASEVVGSAALAGGLGAGLGALGQGISELKIPNRIIQKAIRTDSKGAQHVLDTKKWGTKNSLLTESKSIQSKLETELQSKLADPKLAKVPITRDEVFGKIAEEMNKKGAAETADTVRTSIARAARNSRGLLDKEFLNIKETNQLRRNLDQILGDRAFAKKLFDLPQTKQLLVSARNELADTVKKKAEEGLGNNIVSELFREYSSELNFAKALEKATTGSRVLTTKDVMNFVLGPAGGAIAGGAEGYRQGGLPGAVKGAAIGGVVGTALKPAGLINVSQAAKGIGKVVGPAAKIATPAVTKSISVRRPKSK